MSIGTDKNKAIVMRFNRECIEEGNQDAFNELLADNVINHAAPQGRPNGKESFDAFINQVLRKGFSQLKVDILDQIAEGDLVSTRKTIYARHTGEIFGMPPTNRAVEIQVIDIIRIENGQYAEHWGQSNFQEVMRALASA